MATLVDDLDATVTCPECARVCPVQMQSCPGCLALLRRDQVDPDDDDVVTALAHGLRLHRPAGQAPFASGPGCTLLRLHPQGGLVLCGVEGLIEANLSGPGIRARPPLECGTAGAVLFRLDVYEAAPAAVVAVAADGAPLATYLRVGPLLNPYLEVRDETSAPVARFEPVPRGTGFRVVDTSGRRIGSGDRIDVEDDSWIDDQWSLDVGEERLPMAPLAFVALAVAAKVLLGRAEPERMREEREPDPRDRVDDLGPIAQSIIDGFFS
ncbi:MAG: hypothetical protein ACT4OV_09510 [Microthrixaceae bacterium]